MPELSIFSGMEWLVQCIRPFDTITNALDKQYRENFGAFVAKFWLFPIVLSFSLDLTLFYILDIDFYQNKLFIGYYLLCISFKFLLDALLIYIIFIVFRLRRDLHVIFASYTAVVIYSPFRAAFALPTTYVQYFTLNNIKSQHLDLIDSWKYFQAHGAEISKKALANIDLWDKLNKIFGFIDPVLALFVTFVLAESLTQILETDRFRTYFAVIVGSFFYFIPTIPFSIAQFAIAFAAMR